eukprot:7730279-Alexandrium_andersonii.AAC.1
MSCKEADVSLQLSRGELGSTAASFASQWCARWLAGWRVRTSRQVREAPGPTCLTVLSNYQTQR